MKFNISDSVVCSQLQVTIIIPVYKVESCVERCIDSVLNQTYRRLEVILVDDCTPDRSMEIAKDYIEKSQLSEDIQFKYLKHNHNRGLSAARNTGINAATGDYIFFLDSDDAITHNCIELLLSKTDDGLVDLICGAFELCGSIELFKSSIHFYDAFYSNRDGVVQAFVKDKIPITAWNKLLRRNFVIDNKLFFKEGLLYEDNLWTFELVNFLQSLRTLTDVTYYYWIRPSSIMTSTDRMKRYKNLLTIYSEREKFLRDNKISNCFINKYLIKSKAIWIQCRICDNSIPFRERFRLAFSVLALNDKYVVVGYSFFYLFRWILYNIKKFLKRDVLF